MDFYDIGMIALGLFVLIVVAFRISEKRAISRMSVEERAEHENSIRLDLERQLSDSKELAFGPINTVMVCPHCQTKGKIRTKPVEQKSGISGGKATAAVLTGGVSLLAVGLSRKQELTQAHCEACSSTWHF